MQRKNAYINKSYKWDLVDPYLDVVFKCRGKKSRKNITFRKFKRFLLSGETVYTLLQKGYTYTFLYCMDRFATGKIKVTKKDFENDYKKNSSVKLLMEKYGINKSDVSFLRTIFGIKFISYRTSVRLRNEIALDERQKQILYGSLLGDASRNRKSSVNFVQGENQKKYLFWKYEQFNNLAAPPHRAQYPAKRKIRGEITVTNYISWYVHLYAHSELESINGVFYKNGRKEINEKIYEYFTPLCIAVFWMDDGGTNWHSSIRKKGGRNKPELSFSTQGFSKKSCQVLKKMLYSKYGIKTRLRELIKPKKNGEHAYLTIIENECVDRFIDLIRPHILPMFMYKIDYDAYLIWREKKELKI